MILENPYGIELFSAKPVKTVDFTGFFGAVSSTIFRLMAWASKILAKLMLCQSLSQLNATYGEDNSTVILDNCSVMAYLPGGMNKKTCAYVSEIVNLPLEEIMFLEMGSIVIFQSGKKPKIVPRYPTLNDPLYQKFLEAGKKRKLGRAR